MSTDVTLARYFAESRSWDSDRVAQTRQSARVAWWVAAAACTCAILASIALVALTPLKSAVPFLIRIDNSTGIVDVVPVYIGTATFDETLTRTYLRRYVQTCERFVLAIAESDYNECGAFQAREAKKTWGELWDRNNPLSPLNVNKDGSTVRVRVVSVTFLKRKDVSNRKKDPTDEAQVRYVKIRTAGGSGPEVLSHWIATIQYLYVGPSDDPDIRGVNPLGFKVIEFVAEPEAGPDAAAGGLAGSARAGGRP